MKAPHLRIISGRPVDVTTHEDIPESEPPFDGVRLMEHMLLFFGGLILLALAAALIYLVLVR